MKETLEFIRKFRYTPYLCPLPYVVATFPGTEYWDYAIEKGINVEDYDNIMMDISNDIEDYIRAPLVSSVPVEDLFKIAIELRREMEYKHNKYPDPSTF
jgi:hypothetical protein